MTSSTNPESGTVTYVYNGDNMLQYKHDAKGQETVYAYDSKKRVTMISQFPTGQSHAEDTCQRVSYSWDSNPYNATFSQYTQGRLAAIQYTNCHSFSMPDPNSPDYTDTFGQTTVTENYSYHAAGATTGKQVQLARTSTLGITGYSVATAPVLTASYAYDAAGRLSSASVPQETFSYTYDAMGRPAGMTGTETINGRWGGTRSMPVNWVKNVQYDLAGRMSSMQYQTAYGMYGAYGAFGDPSSAYWLPWGRYATESRAYNLNGQLTSIGWTTPGVDQYPASGPSGTITYGYSATQNNGQITQVTDTMSSAETITYQYDSLKRMISAAATSGSSSTWTQTYQYDGFGNLTGKALNGGANSIPWTVDPATNRFQSGASYDLNGNLLTGPGVTLSYDESNRVSSAALGSAGTEYYGYAPDNKRIYRQNTATGQEEWTFYGARGEKIGTFQFDLNYAWTVMLRETGRSVWFGGKLIWDGAPVPMGGYSMIWDDYHDTIFPEMLQITGGDVYQDRLGSNRALAARYYPYGEEIGTATANGREKFATYTRDAATTLDYADQRYYASSYGRFNTADPMRASAGPEDPGSWNRYAYVGGDPINMRDPSGLCAEDTDYSVSVCDSVDDDPFDASNGDGYSDWNSSGSSRASKKNMRANAIRANLGHAGGMLLVREAISPKCQGALDALGVDFDVLAVTASIVDIQNGVGDQQSIASAFGTNAALGAAAQAQYDKQYSGYLQDHNLQHLTVGDYFAATGTTAAWTPFGGGTVFFNPALVDISNPAATEGLMLHEMLHESYGLDDTAIMKTLLAYDPKSGINPLGASHQISDWLTPNCVTGKGNK